MENCKNQLGALYYLARKLPAQI